MEGYSTYRSQQVDCNNLLSNETAIRAGVRRGSVIGPLMFVIHTADIIKSLTCGPCHAFGDDNQLVHFFKPRDFNRAEMEINSELDHLYGISYCSDSKLNPSESEVMVFSDRKSQAISKNCI
ncbi:hypothetical protein JTB14_038137 [Gonioctena quinquepunctata]|nr:hypothetical protein JTB14_038137 [Gonioctena quinquepunctata]